jgi:hypothetical protein
MLKKEAEEAEEHSECGVLKVSQRSQGRLLGNQRRNHGRPQRGDEAEEDLSDSMSLEDGREGKGGGLERVTGNTKRFRRSNILKDVARLQAMAAQMAKQSDELRRHAERRRGGGPLPRMRRQTEAAKGEAEASAGATPLYQHEEILTANHAQHNNSV